MAAVTCSTWSGAGGLVRRALTMAAAIAVVAVMAVPAAALSDDEYRKMVASSREFKEADARLNAAWKGMIRIMPKEAAAQALKTQRMWVNSWRDKEVDRLIRDVAPGGVAEGLAPRSVKKDGKVDRTLVYAYLTNEKARFMEIYARQLADKAFVPSFKGSVTGGKDEAGRFYGFWADGWWEFFTVCHQFAADQLSPRTKETLDRLLEESRRPEANGVSGRVEIRGRLAVPGAIFVQDRNLEVRLLEPQKAPKEKAPDAAKSGADAPKDAKESKGDDAKDGKDAAKDAKTGKDDATRIGTPKATEGVKDSSVKDGAKSEAKSPDDRLGMPPKAEREKGAASDGKPKLPTKAEKEEGEKDKAPLPRK